MTRRSLRLAAVALVAAMALPLSACDTQPGTAAFVGDTRITMSQVDGQVDTFYQDPFWAKQTEGQRGIVRLRTVNAMVILELLRHWARDEKIDVKNAEVDKQEAAFKKAPGSIDRLFQGAPTRVVAEIYATADPLRKSFEKNGVSPDAANQQFLDRLKGAPKKYPVTMNPRFGTFDPSVLDLGPAKEAGVRDLPQAPQSGQQGQQGRPQQGQQGEPQQGQPQG